MIYFLLLMFSVQLLFCVSRAKTRNKSLLVPIVIGLLIVNYKKKITIYVCVCVKKSR